MLVCVCGCVWACEGVGVCVFLCMSGSVWGCICVGLSVWV
jgi:hypothetical protein